MLSELNYRDKTQLNRIKLFADYQNKSKFIAHGSELAFGVQLGQQYNAVSWF